MIFPTLSLVFTIFVNSLTTVVANGRKRCNQLMLHGGRVGWIKRSESTISLGTIKIWSGTNMLSAFCYKRLTVN